MQEAAPLRQIHRTRVLLGKRELIYFSGCDYFRMASNPRVLKAAATAVTTHGLNVAASRVTTGNHPIYLELEQALADFFGAPAATLVNSGYSTNLIVAQTLAGWFKLALIDARAHPSLQDASRFLGCEVATFEHRNPASVRSRLEGHTGPVILLTDGMFSHDGSIAPLKVYLQILSSDALILVDDAHGAGVAGPTGRGSLEHEKISRSRIIQTVTLSKAFGSHGGAILGPHSLRREIFSKSRMFAGNTPMALPLAVAALQSVRMLGRNRALHKRLMSKAKKVKAELGLTQLLQNPGPIVPIHLPTARAAVRFKKVLLQAGIFPPFIHYPGGPAGGYFRFVISSEHSREDLDKLISVLRPHLEAS